MEFKLKPTKFGDGYGFYIKKTYFDDGLLSKEKTYRVTIEPIDE